MNRHYKSCKSKSKCELTEIIKKKDMRLVEKEKRIKEKDDKLKEKDDKLKKKDEKLREKEKKLQELEKEYFAFMKKIAEKEGGVNNTITNNTINMYYILNNYKNAHNIEQLMEPPLTENEIEYILQKGAVAGCYKLITGRCIDNIQIDKRPFHCVDGSRNKYLLHTEDEWSIDLNGNKILRETYPKVRGAFDIQVNRGDSMEVVNEKLKNIDQIRDLERYGKKRILKILNKKTLLKNNITE